MKYSGTDIQTETRSVQNLVLNLWLLLLDRSRVSESLLDDPSRTEKAPQRNHSVVSNHWLPPSDCLASR